ncbi:MAG: helix-turn-helix transcriptional regulator [Bacillota bacterium]
MANENKKIDCLYWLSDGFRNKLIDCLNEKSLTQNQFAKLIGTSQQNVNRWCNGKAFPSYEFLIAICTELDITPNEIMGWE